MLTRMIFYLHVPIRMYGILTVYIISLFFSRMKASNEIIFCYIKHRKWLNRKPRNGRHEKISFLFPLNIVFYKYRKTFRVFIKSESYYRTPLWTIHSHTGYKCSVYSRYIGIRNNCFLTSLQVHNIPHLLWVVVY